MEFLPATESENSYEPYKSIPEYLKKYLIPGFRCIAYPTAFGEVLTQIRKVREFTLNVHLIIATEEGEFRPTPGLPIHTIHYMYRGKASAELNGKGKVNLTAGEYNRFYVPASKHKASFEIGKYWCIHLDLSPQLFQRYPDQLNELTARLKHVDPAVGVIFNETPLLMKFGERKILSEILKCRLEGGEQRKFLYEKCVDLFTKYLEQHYVISNKATQLVLTDQQSANLMAARGWVMDHLYAEITPGTVARKFDLPLDVFRRGFLKMFGQTLEEFLFYKRMTIAGMEICDRKLSIKSIMTLVGYEDKVVFEGHIKFFYSRTIEELRTEYPLNPEC
jgi:AraC-like DNA-binding protein